jgi:hypothetical protein
MTLRQIIWLLSTDAFYITVGKKGIDETVYVEASAKNSYHELKAYFDYEVETIIPADAYVEIILKK